MYCCVSGTSACTLKEASWGILVPMPEGFVGAIRTVGIDTLLQGSESGGACLCPLVKCAVGRAALNTDWDKVPEEVE